jgi:hypothetical protein
MAECIVAIDHITDDAIQGPMRLADAWCCLDCEVVFTGRERCPSCAGGAIWPVADEAVTWGELAEAWLMMGVMTLLLLV